MSEVKNWGEYKESLLEDVSSDKERGMLNTLMENVHARNVASVGDPQQKNHVLVEAETGGGGGTPTGNISRYDMMFMPLVRRTAPALLAMDLVGVQPTTGPQGIVRSMKFNYSDDTPETGSGSPFEVEAGTEASGQNVYEKYSLLARGGAYDEVDSLNPFERTEYLESEDQKTMNLEVMTDRVDTYGRKLSSTWSLEAKDDLDALDGLDIEQEVNQALGDEIVREMDRELLNKMNGLAGTVDSFSFANVSGRYAGEKLSSMLIEFDNLSAQIAMKTKRSGATWMVVSQRVFTGMKNAANSTFVPANNGDLNISSSLFVGTYGGNISVYVDPYLKTDTVLMGRKESETDTGLIYVPYLPMYSTGVMNNIESLDQKIAMRTRYGLYAATDEQNSLNDAADQYARLTISDLKLGLTN